MTFRKLKADEIDCRVKQITEKGLSLLLYKDARVDQNILDETVGPYNWQRHHSRDNANCTVAIWDSEKAQWIEKEDTGTESNTEAQKGLASDSFKRACFNWGIGRELYTAPRIWIKAEDIKWEEPKNGKPFTYDSYEVSKIDYDAAGSIKSLVIRNAKTKKVVFTMGSSTKETPKQEAPKQETPKKEAPKAEGGKIENYIPSEEEMKAIARQKIDATKIAILANGCNENGVPVEKLLKLYKKSTLADITEAGFANIVNNWDNIRNAKV